MDWEVLLTRIFPTGSQIKPNYDYGAIQGCRRIATGTIKGMGNIWRLEHPDRDSPFNFHVLPKLDCWFGVAAGIIPESDIVFARDSLMTPAQFARTYLVLYTESKEYFPTSAIRACAQPELLPAAVTAGQRFAATGPVTFGMDFEGQGDSDTASATTVTFLHQPAPGMVHWLYAQEWPVGTPPGDVREEVVELCRFFRPTAGAGDAYDTTLIYEINRDLYAAGHTRINVGTLQNKPGRSGWDSWFFRPVRFHGLAKHQMYKRLQSRILGQTLRWPVPIEDHPRYRGLTRFLAQLENVKARQTKDGYDSFRMIRKALGDDYVDSAAAALHALGDRKAAPKAFGGGVKMGGFSTHRDFAARRDFADRSFKG